MANQKTDWRNLDYHQRGKRIEELETQRRNYQDVIEVIRELFDDPRLEFVVHNRKECAAEVVKSLPNLKHLPE